MESTKPETNAQVSPIKAGLFVLIAAAVMYYPLSNFFGFSLSFGDNVLEKALHPGSSNKDQFAAFMDKGGLEFESSWKGYGVKSVNAHYHDNGKLAIAEIILWKKMIRRDLASVENLKSSLSSECGPTWQASSQANITMYKAEKNGVECAMQYHGEETEVVLVKRKP